MPRRLHPNAKIPHSTSERFDGVYAAVAYSLHECRLDKPPNPGGEYCFTVRPGGPNGKVAAHVDRVLMEDVEFVVRESGVRRIRAAQVREVIAFAVGTIRAPSQRNLRKLDLDSAAGVTFNPFKDRTFVLRDDRSVPVYTADWCYFSGRRGVVLGYSSVHSNPGATLTDLEAVTASLGGCVACDDSTPLRPNIMSYEDALSVDMDDMRDFLFRRIEDANNGSDEAYYLLRPVLDDAGWGDVEDGDNDYWRSDRGFLDEAEDQVRHASRAQLLEYMAYRPHRRRRFEVGTDESFIAEDEVASRYDGG